jgi:hypothetical protein
MYVLFQFDYTLKQAKTFNIPIIPTFKASYQQHLGLLIANSVVSFPYSLGEQNSFLYPLFVEGSTNID